MVDGSPQLNKLEIDAQPVTPMRPKKSLGRPKSGSTEKTRERILFEAERLFAEGGYDGTSIRNVAKASGLQIQAIGYHFGNKESLFQTVVGRRAEILNAMRDEALLELRKQAGDKPIALEALVRAYVRPFIASANSDDKGWQNFAALMGRLANSPLGTATISKHYNTVAQTYVDEFQRALKGVDKAAIVNGVMFMVASMLWICSDTGRSSELTGSRATDMESDYEHLVNYTVAGFAALGKG
ncbi:MAG: TetR/AcrR family transcriptional regulator [Ahrensia sp.]|nr:TetR/AcrR family transcriptional regulator [Ahrensia sp.]